MASANLEMAQPPPAPPPWSYTDLFGDPIYDLTQIFKNDLFLPPDFDFKVRTLRHSSPRFHFLSLLPSTFVAMAKRTKKVGIVEKYDLPLIVASMHKRFMVVPRQLPVEA
ncbi:uncharacterized protein LOC110706197 isoform X2 [Chenopodium quinoa]|uniref:uncharacterized protein LOC110706197 isoform X2 n=1 Tax=Chenopodium quinoa TaxID=63459 RepID=UPI000B7829EE|nr:uncharacterized protein LOC110706197 isoform X2 [Chenopodium quinoa]